MSGMCPYSPTVLAKLAANAKVCVERGETDALVSMCGELLPWARHADVDPTLGRLLKLLLRHGSAARIVEIEAEAFPLDRLSHGWNPQDASVAYLSWKYRQTFQPDRDPDVAQVRALAVVVQALWPHLDEATRLAHGLYAKLATVHGIQGNVQALRNLSEDLLAGPLNDERQQTALLRIIKQLQRLRAATEIEVLLEQLLSRPGHNPAWVEAALTAVAALQSLAQRLSDFERLRRLLARTFEWLEPQGRALCDARLVKALLRCAEFDQLHRLLPHLLVSIDDVGVRSLLLSVLDQLLRYDVLGDAGQYIELTYRLDPGDPIAALLFGRYLNAQREPDPKIEPVFETLRHNAPGYDDAVLWRAQQYYGLAQHAKLRGWLDSHPLNSPDKAHFLLNRVQAATDRHPFPNTVSEADGNRLSTHTMGSLAPLLEPLAQVLNGDLSDAAEPPLPELRNYLRAIALAVTRATEPSRDLAFADCINTVGILRRAAGTLVFLAAGGYRYDPSGQGRRPPQLPQYGGPDQERVRAIFETLHRVAMQLSSHAIEAALQDASLADVRHLCVLMDLHVESACALGEVQSSEALLHMLRERQIALPYVLRSLEHCAFERGDLLNAKQWMTGQVLTTGEFFPLESFDSWARMEGGQARVLVEQDPSIGTFEYINPQGTLLRVPHEVPGTRIAFVQTPGLRIRGVELLIGPNGTMLRPNPEHRRDVPGYPSKSSVRLNYGHGGCRLRPPKERLRVREPVVVLANMDGPYWNNYYHWMMTILTRVAFLLECGELDHRRLLLPMELSEWMITSLELVGLSQGRMLRYTAEQEVLTDDAWVVGSVEWAAAALMNPLQRRLWAVAGVDPHGEASRAVWLSRRQEPQRYLANSDAIEALAKRLGFDVINPGTLSLLDQVRLCAGAKILAGPEGSNFTNLMFARPATRVLTLMLAGGDYETWLDICVMGHLPQRWIFGRADPRKAWWPFHHEPYEVDLSIVERELLRLTDEAL